MKNRKKLTIIIFWIAVIVWMALIFNLSSQPASQSNELSTGITEIIVNTVKKVAPKSKFNIETFNHYVRKNAHFFAYLVLGVLVINASRRKYLSILICVLYAISDEVHQSFVPGRGPQVKDVFIDSCGALVGILIFLLIMSVRIKKKSGKINDKVANDEKNNILER